MRVVKIGQVSKGWELTLTKSRLVNLAKSSLSQKARRFALAPPVYGFSGRFGLNLHWETKKFRA
jgi:hypothetical protein